MVWSALSTKKRKGLSDPLNVGSIRGLCICPHCRWSVSDCVSNARGSRISGYLPATLGVGERESIAIARARGGTVFSNESRVAHHGRTHGVPCVRLPDILRALWMESIVSQQEVQEIIRDLQVKDQMQFTPVHPPGHLRRVKPLPAGAGDASASTGLSTASNRSASACNRSASWRCSATPLRPPDL